MEQYISIPYILPVANKELTWRWFVILDNKHIAVVGLGSGGSALADMLARYGVKKLTLIDPDGLSHENVKRHILTRTSVGNFKVVGMENHLLMASEKGTITIHIQRFDSKMFSEP